MRQKNKRKKLPVDNYIVLEKQHQVTRIVSPMVAKELRKTKKTRFKKGETK